MAERQRSTLVYQRQNSQGSHTHALKEERKRIKEEEEQAMREALGLAPKRSSRPQGSRLDKHEFQELVKRGSTAEDMGAGHAEAAWVHGLGFSRGAAPRPREDPSTLQSGLEEVSPDMEKPIAPNSPPQNVEKEESEDESSRNRRRKDEKHEKHERREKRRSHDSDEKRKHRKDKEKRRRRHDSD